ncbi:predicted protein [Naegleria gruberi]|uniref:Predicted protein n=1 Tax=Naegleria gruberi TaxID=5762 RepID=D2VHN8_NAEGR|nr:uncharacterized protein NAEGRDRAFT_68391 [Naegleria gruberi]EFC43623.1 predicted protein [Naegleria gruberi]|eukprot:XP_002676367.1 predicted protein [Naegleria gruberi strain NEG-M]
MIEIKSSIPEGRNPSQIYDNFIVNSMEQNINVHYFALSENQAPLVTTNTDQQLQVIIDQVVSKQTIIVISSESYTTNILFSITDKYSIVKSNFLANIQYILVNSKFKATFKFKDESLSSQITVKYYCDDLCGANTFISTKDAYIWNSGGSTMELEMRQRIGANYTTYIGCDKSSSFTFMNPINECENGDTNLIITVVLSVVLGSCCLACLCTCLFSILGCLIKLALN